MRLKLEEVYTQLEWLSARENSVHAVGLKNLLERSEWKEFLPFDDDRNHSCS